MRSTLEVWEFDPSCDREEVVRLASARVAPPSFTGRTLSRRGDVLTVQVVAGSPSGDRQSLYYVAGLGTFGLARQAGWPPPPGGGAQRILLTLLAAREPSSAAAPP